VISYMHVGMGELMEKEVRILKEELLSARQQLATQTKKVSDLTAFIDEQQADARKSTARCEALEHELKDMRGYKLQCQTLEGSVEALQQEAHRLKSARAVLDEDLRETRAASEARAREIAQIQGSAALNKSKMDDQAAQLLILKQQLLDMEEEVCALHLLD
jgi:chromosome segregation ATPase